MSCIFVKNDQRHSILKIYDKMDFIIGQNKLVKNFKY